jgi:hypothetical protein
VSTDLTVVVETVNLVKGLKMRHERSNVKQYVRATLDESPRSRVVQLNKAILLVESHKLDPWPLLDESRRPKSGKSRLNLHGTILEGK